MIVTCTACETRFRVPPGKIGPKGARLRCSRCRAVFFSGPETYAPAEAAGATSGPARVEAGAHRDTAQERTPEFSWSTSAAGPAPDAAAATDPFAGSAWDRPPAAAGSHEDPFWFRSAGALLGNEQQEALPAPADLAATFDAAAAASAAPDEPRWPDLETSARPAEAVASDDAGVAPPDQDHGAALPFDDPGERAQQRASPATPDSAADAALAAYLAGAGASLPELETPTPAPERSAAPSSPEAAPAASQSAALTREFELAWPEGDRAATALALDEPAKTGAHPLEVGGVDLGFASDGDPWAGTGVIPARGSVTEAPAVDAAPRGATASVAPAGGTPPPAALAAPEPARRAAPTPAPAVAPRSQPPAAEPAPRPETTRRRTPLSEPLWLGALALMAVALLVGWRWHLLSRIEAAVSQRGAPLVETTGLRGGLYDTATGSPALVVRGDVVARTATDGPIRVRVELLDGRRVVASAVVLAGATATPEEVFGAGSEGAAAALRQSLDERAAHGLASGAVAPFFVVFPPPAPDPRGLELRASAEPAATAAAR